MKQESLTLIHQSLLVPRLAALQLNLSEYDFTNLFLFRREHDYQVIFDDELTWIRGKTRDGFTYLMPTQDIRQIPSTELLKKLDWADCFFPIPESWTSSFDPSFFTFRYTRDDSDYLFTRTKIAEYPGRNLSAKRNLLKNFLQQYTPTVVPYTQENYQDALYILDEWQKHNGSLDTDYLACKEGLQYAQELGIKGYFISVEGRPAGFILGSFPRKCSFTIHFTKALREFKGIYPFMFQELAKQLSSDQICCLNWEQDLGIEGLRQSKESYQPDHIAHKMRIFSKVR